jgi:hypothetical protein
VESSCELGKEPSGSIKCWELPKGCTSCGLSSGTQLHRVSLVILNSHKILTTETYEVPTCYVHTRSDGIRTRDPSVHVVEVHASNSAKLLIGRIDGYVDHPKLEQAKGLMC